MIFCNLVQQQIAMGDGIAFPNRFNAWTLAAIRFYKPSTYGNETKSNLLNMRISFIIFLLLFTLSCNRSKNLTKEEIYTILNEIVRDDSLALHTVCSKVESLEISKDFGFTEADKDFITYQITLFKDFKFEKNKLFSYSRRKKSFEYIILDTTCNSGTVTRLSFPLISKNRDRVVFENTEDCHCMLGGQGGQDLYVKQNGHWKKQNSFGRWISQIYNH